MTSGYKEYSYFDHLPDFSLSSNRTRLQRKGSAYIGVFVVGCATQGVTVRSSEVTLHSTKTHYSLHGISN